MTRHLALVSAVCLTALTNALAQQPPRQERSKDEQPIWTALQLRQVLDEAQEMQRKVARQKQVLQEQLERLRQVLGNSDDPEMRMLFEKRIQKLPFLFDGIQWERCRTLRCSVRG